MEFHLVFCIKISWNGFKNSCLKLKLVMETVINISNFIELDVRIYLDKLMNKKITILNTDMNIVKEIQLLTYYLHVNEVS